MTDRAALEIVATYLGRAHPGSKLATLMTDAHVRYGDASASDLAHAIRSFDEKVFGQALG